MDVEHAIGSKILYKDYLGYLRSGIIAWVEPYNGPENDDPNSQIVWLYVADEDPEYNIHEFVVNMGTMDKPDIKHIMYADMRLSTEVEVDN